MYDPTVGRFLTEDPIGLQGGDFNFYRYCGNSPTNATDATGLKTQYSEELKDARGTILGTINVMVEKNHVEGGSDYGFRFQFTAAKGNTVKLGWIQHEDTAGLGTWRYDNAAAGSQGSKSDPTLAKQPVARPAGMEPWTKNPWFGGGSENAIKPSKISPVDGNKIEVHTFEYCA